MSLSPIQQLALVSDLKQISDANRRALDDKLREYLGDDDSDARVAEMYFQSMVGELLGFATGAGWTLEHLLDRIRAQRQVIGELARLVGEVKVPRRRG